VEQLGLQSVPMNNLVTLPLRKPSIMSTSRLVTVIPKAIIALPVKGKKVVVDRIRFGSIASKQWGIQKEARVTPNKYLIVIDSRNQGTPH
jgi:hypothetical protein